MSKDSIVSGISDERNREGPDFFGYYNRQVVELLSQDEDFLPFELPGEGSGQVRVEDGVIENGNKVSDSCFSNGIGAGLSDFRRERLKTMLCQAVIVLSAEIDEMLYPVIQTRGLQNQRRNRKRSSRLSGAASEDDGGQVSCKKLKVSPSSSSTGLPQLASPTDPESNVAPKISPSCQDAETIKCTTSPEDPKVDDDDRKFLIENDSSQVEEILKKLADELSEKLGRMEQQLEELLDAVMSKCRPTTLAEKKQLQKMIKGLPPKNLDRVVELIRRSKPAEERSSDEIHVDLEKENNATLWRLYYYLQAVEKARKLSNL